jgi:hypothetical protein
MHDTLRDQIHVADGRDPQPSAAILDSRSAKSSEGGEQIGYDAGKRVRGRKRHLLVDTLGLMLVGIVHSASVQDRENATRHSDSANRDPKYAGDNTAIARPVDSVACCIWCTKSAPGRKSNACTTVV